MLHVAPRLSCTDILSVWNTCNIYNIQTVFLSILKTIKSGKIDLKMVHVLVSPNVMLPKQILLLLKIWSDKVPHLQWKKLLRLLVCRWLVLNGCLSSNWRTEGHSCENGQVFYTKKYKTVTVKKKLESLTEGETWIYMYILEPHRWLSNKHWWCKDQNRPVVAKRIKTTGNIFIQNL